MKDLARETRENVFEDQRLGEGLDEDDAMLLRFQRERTKRTRTSRRGLDDELTHGGKPLSDAAISAAFAFGADADAAEIAARAARVVEHVSLDGVSAKQCVSALARVRAIDKGAGEALRAKCASAFPRGEAFKA